MSNLVEVKVPDIGDFKDVPVIEVLVKPGEAVSKEASLVTLESDKATMEVPSPAAGVVKELKVKVGDKVSEGALVLILEAADVAAAAPQQRMRQLGTYRIRPRERERAPREVAADLGELRGHSAVFNCASLSVYLHWMHDSVTT